MTFDATYLDMAIRQRKPDLKKFLARAPEDWIFVSLAEQMVLHSDAIGVLTYSKQKREALREGLKILPIDLPNSERDIGLTFRKHQPLTVAQRAFVDILMAARGDQSSSG